MRRFFHSTALTALLLAVGLAAGGCPAGPGPDWTTDSEAAHKEFLLGLQDRMRVYESDAFSHFEEALRLDPEFVSAKVQLLRLVQGERAAHLAEAIRAANLDELSPRERFLARFQLARYEGDGLGATRLLEEYLEVNPKDPFALDLQGRRLYALEELDGAEEVLQRLLQVEPNWVQAQNLLGYIAMARGDFAQAEDRFCTYAYIAPDQANPYDSQGELMLIVGRYDEARGRFEKALELRPNFTPSLINLAYLEFITGDFDSAAATLARGLEEGVLGPKDYENALCMLEMWSRRSTGDFEGAWRTGKSCPDAGPDVALTLLKSALATGRKKEAKLVLEKIRSHSTGHGMPGMLEESAELYQRFRKSVLLQAEAIKAEADGRYDQALYLYGKADQALGFRNRAFATLKLSNLANLERLQRHLGDERAAEDTRRRIETVNPSFLPLFKKVPAPPWLARAPAAPAPPESPPAT